MSCLLGATLCWGSVPVMLKYLTGELPDGYTTNLIRYPVSALIYLPWLIWGIRKGGLGRFWLAALIPAGINIIGQTLWAAAPYHLDAGLLAFLFRLNTLFGILGAFCLFPDERRLIHSPRFWLGGVLALVGFCVMSAIGLRGGVGTSVAGVVIIFFCSICYGLYGVAVRYVMRDLHPLVVFSVISAFTSIGLIPLSLFGQPASVLQLNGSGWGILILSAILGVAMAHGLFYISVQRIGVAISSMALMATPFVSFLGSHLVFGERFSQIQWAGGLALLAGSSLAVWSQQHLPLETSERCSSESSAQP